MDDESQNIKSLNLYKNDDKTFSIWQSRWVMQQRQHREARDLERENRIGTPLHKMATANFAASTLLYLEYTQIRDTRQR